MFSNANLIDVIPTLANPEDYVRGIVGRFISLQFDRVEAVLRLGISGSGIHPHYCIEEGSEPVTFPKFEISAHRRRVVFHGRSHKEILESSFKGISWSTSSMTFYGVQALLGRLRARNKAH